MGPANDGAGRGLPKPKEPNGEEQARAIKTAAAAMKGF